MAVDKKRAINILSRVAVLAVLVFVLLFVLVNFGFLKCCDIPGFCGIYYGIKGTPRVAIIYGDDGTGDPQFLQTQIIREIHSTPALLPLQYVKDAATLDQYQIIIVEHARTIPTQTLNVLQQYSQKGGKLVWIADAGTALSDSDYVCEKISFIYTPASVETNPDNTTRELCLNYERTETPDVPSEVKGGICGRSFGELVLNFKQTNQTVYQTAQQAGLCSKPGSFRVQGAEQIEKCLKKLNATDTDATAVEAKCAGMYNYWKRGPSLSATGDQVKGIDFSQLVLGMDFVSSFSNGTSTNLFLQAVSDHELVKGYESATNWFGVSDATLVSTERFSAAPRSHTLMHLELATAVNGKKTWPAVVISNPLGSPFQRGNIVYYAFPLENLFKENRGTRLLNNLFNYLTC